MKRVEFAVFTAVCIHGIYTLFFIFSSHTRRTCFLTSYSIIVCLCFILGCSWQWSDASKLIAMLFYKLFKSPWFVFNSLLAAFYWFNYIAYLYDAIRLTHTHTRLLTYDPLKHINGVALDCRCLIVLMCGINANICKR